MLFNLADHNANCRCKMFQVEGVYGRQICYVVKGKERENGKLEGVRSEN